MGNIVLAALVIYVILTTIGGFRKGFLKSLFGLASWLLTFAIAAELVQQIKEPVINAYLAKTGEVLSDTLAYGLSFIIAIIILKIIFTVIGHIINKVSDAPVIGGLNKALGGALGFIKGLVVVSIVLFVIYLMPYIGMQEIQESIIKDSSILREFVNQNIFLNILKNLLTNHV